MPRYTIQYRPLRTSFEHGYIASQYTNHYYRDGRRVVPSMPDYYEYDTDKIHSRAFLNQKAIDDFASWYNRNEAAINSRNAVISLPPMLDPDVSSLPGHKSFWGSSIRGTPGWNEYLSEVRFILNELKSKNNSGGNIRFNGIVAPSAAIPTDIAHLINEINVIPMKRQLKPKYAAMVSPDFITAYTQIPNLLKSQKQEEVEELKKQRKYEEAINVLNNRLGQHDSKIGTLEYRLANELDRIALSSISDIDNLRMGLQTQQANSVAPDKFNDLERSVHDLDARLAGLNDLNARLEKLKDLNVSITQLKEKSDEQGTTFLNRLQATERAIEDSRQNLNSSIQRIHTDTVQNLQRINTTNHHLNNLRTNVDGYVRSLESDIAQRTEMIHTRIRQSGEELATANDRKLQDLRRDLDAEAKNTRELFNIYSEKLSIVKPSKVVTIMPRPTKLADRFRRIGTRGRFLHLMLEPIV